MQYVAVRDENVPLKSRMYRWSVTSGSWFPESRSRATPSASHSSWIRSTCLACCSPGGIAQLGHVAVKDEPLRAGPERAKCVGAAHAAAGRAQMRVGENDHAFGHAGDTQRNSRVHTITPVDISLIGDNDVELKRVRVIHDLSQNTHRRWIAPSG